ncbi:MAG TPA: hypothetical protein VKX49_12525 [Bryobacteraceae bacterium]|nr:hypothetical protein [Bryobacteraceae bacterium]
MTTRACTISVTAGHMITVEVVGANGVSQTLTDSNSVSYAAATTALKVGAFPISNTSPSASYTMWHLCNYPSTANTTFTATFGSSSTYSGIYVQEWSGNATTTCEDTGFHNFGTAAAASDVYVGPILATYPNELLIAWGNEGAIPGLTAASGWTQIVQDTNNGAGVSYQLASSTGTYWPQIHATGAVAWDGFVIGFKLPGSVAANYPTLNSVSAFTRYNDQYNGSNGLPNNGRFSHGDTPHLTTDNNGVTYTTANDGTGFQPGGCGSQSIVLAKYLSAGYLNGSDVNCMTEYGSAGSTNVPSSWTDNLGWKSAGQNYVVDANHTGSHYWWVNRQLDSPSGGTPWLGTTAFLMRSLDHGVSWCKPAHSTGIETCSITPDVNGDVPVASDTPTFSGTKFIRNFFVQFEQPSTGATNVDGNSTYLYIVSADYLETSYYLARCARNVDCTQSGQWQAYVGAVGGDPLNNSNWSSTLTAPTLFLFNPQSVAVDVPGASGPKYVAGLGYIWLQTGMYQPYDLTVFWAAKLTDRPVLLNTGGVAGGSMLPNYPEFDLSSATWASGAVTLTVLQSGDYINSTGNPATDPYSSYYRTINLTPAVAAPGASALSGISLSGGVRVQ